jgi:hypothetical protein
MKDTNTHKALTIKTLTKHNVWDIQENDVFRIWESGKKDSDGNENLRYYADIIRCAFLLEEIKDDSPHIIAKYEKLGYKVCAIKNDEHSKTIWCIKKKPITMVTDLTYENIGHITAQKLIEVLDRNFGGGWESLSQSIQDIIESAFDISTTILPKDRLHKPGGMYEKKVADGYEVLEVSKGTWVEAIFAKAKPQAEKPRLKFNMKSDDEDIIDEDNYNKDDDYDDDIEEPSSFDDEEMNEDNYRTTFEIEEADEEEEANNLSDDI